MEPQQNDCWIHCKIPAIILPFTTVRLRSWICTGKMRNLKVIKESTNKRIETGRRGEHAEKYSKEKGKFKQLVKKIARLTKNKKVRGPDKNKTFTDYTKQHQARIRQQLKEQCENGLSFLGLYEFLPSKIELFNMGTGEVEYFTFGDGTEDCGERKVTDDELNAMNTWLCLKDRFNISNDALHELSMKSDAIPCLNKLIKHMNNMNKDWNL